MSLDSKDRLALKIVRSMRKMYELIDKLLDWATEPMVELEARYA